MKHWQYLSKGDLVDIVAPASQTSHGAIDSGVNWLHSLGLRATAPPDMVKGDVFFAAPLEEQFEYLKAALYSESKAIWSVRGGYGSMRLIPLLKKLSPPKKPKLLLGFSDITALHLYFTQEWGWPSLHSRNISAMKVGTARKEDKLIADILFGKTQSHTYRKLIPLNEAALVQKTITGKITGGNLRIVQSSLKTSWEIETKGKIIFAEDVGERGYSIHRMFEQLIQAKLLDKGIKAVVLGDFTEGEEKNGKDLTGEALKRFAQRVGYPVLRGVPAGHGTTNFPIPFNTKSELSLGKNAQLHCHFGGA